MRTKQGLAAAKAKGKILGRPLTITAPDNSVTTYTYAVADNTTVNGVSRLNRTQVFDALNRVTNYFYDNRGQLVKVRENTGVASPYTAYADTEYTYDLMGNLTWVKTKLPTQDGSGTVLRTVSMSYDAYGRKTTMTDPDMGTWSYAYDAAGNLVEQVDAKSQRLCFTYDALNRLQYKRHDSTGNGCDTGDTQLAYYNSGTGKVGQLSEIRWSSSATSNRETFNYDTLGRLISHTRIIDSRSYTMGYSNFDAFHRPTTITYPNG